MRSRASLAILLVAALLLAAFPTGTVQTASLVEVTSLTVNGVNFTNLYASPNSLPPRMPDGYWYSSYTGNYPWSHFEVR